MGGRKQYEGAACAQSSVPLGQQHWGLSVCPDGTAGAAWVAAATKCLHVPQVSVGSWRSRFLAFLTDYAAVEVVMGLAGWVLQPFLSQLQSPCTSKIASRELNSFP